MLSRQSPILLSIGTFTKAVVAIASIKILDKLPKIIPKAKPLPIIAKILTPKNSNAPDFFISSLLIS